MRTRRGGGRPSTSSSRFPPGSLKRAHGHPILMGHALNVPRDGAPGAGPRSLGTRPGCRLPGLHPRGPRGGRGPRTREDARAPGDLRGGGRGVSKARSAPREEAREGPGPEDRDARRARRGPGRRPRPPRPDPRPPRGGAQVLPRPRRGRSEEHTSELQSRENLVCRLLLEKKKKNKNTITLPKKKKHKQTSS